MRISLRSRVPGTPKGILERSDTGESSIGYNFEPNELSSAYGLVQIDKLEGFNAQRRANWRRLDDFMATRTGVRAGRTTAGTDTTWMRFCFTVESDAGFDRTQAQQFLAARGVSTRMASSSVPCSSTSTETIGTPIQSPLPWGCSSVG